MTVFEYLKQCIERAQEKVGPQAIVRINPWPKPLFTIHEHEGGPEVGSGNEFEDALKSVKIPTRRRR